MENTNDFAVTFGQKYRHESHPTLGDRVDVDGFLLVRAPDQSTARLLIHGLTQKHWAFLYPYNTESERASVDEYNPNGPFATLTLEFNE